MSSVLDALTGTPVGLSRRAFVSAAVGLAAGLVSVRHSEAAGAATYDFPVGLELYSLSKELLADFEGTLHRVAAMGYREVELPDLYGRTVEQMRHALDAAGLRCASGHVPASSFVEGMPSLEHDADTLFGMCRDLGVTYVVCGLPPMRADRKPTLDALKADAAGAIVRYFDSLTLEDWKWTADFLNTVGAQAARRGLMLAYHNHSAEFRPLGATSGYDELLRLTDSQVVKMELDCGWARAAGRDPAALLAASSDRYRLVHLKDLKLPAQPDYHNRMEPAEVGAGVIDWRRLLTAAQGAGVRYTYVEQEPPYARPAVDIVQRALAYFRTLKVRPSLSP
ncbi:MAG TPA: sugar phosphate isomerase/epimerase family protein [Steroidobacteraceae bacterium]|nr:sugar phosphate isomerase/epimerase family protein [Steroidobacteraceae bacterium]